MIGRVRSSGVIVGMTALLLLGCRPSPAIEETRLALRGDGEVMSIKSPEQPSDRDVVLGAPSPQAAQIELTAALASGAHAPLTVQLGGSIALLEPLPTRGGDRTVKFDVRDSDGSKTALVEKPLEPNQSVTYHAQRPGYASVHRCTRPAELDDLPDAWQIASLCEITHVRVGAREEGDWTRDAYLTTKIGLPVELRPYRSTAQLQPGEILPVRLYQKGIPMTAHEITARGPQGEVIRKVSNHRGFVDLEIPSAGRWVIEGVVAEPVLTGGEATVRLQFDVEGSAQGKEVK